MQIAAADRNAMNSLLSQRVKKATPVDSITSEVAKADHAEEEAVRESVVREDMKTSAKNEGWDEQAFNDHKEYLDLLEDVMSEDQKESWEPNDVNQD